MHGNGLTCVADRVTIDQSRAQTARPALHATGLAVDMHEYCLAALFLVNRRPGGLSAEDMGKIDKEGNAHLYSEGEPFHEGSRLLICCLFICHVAGLLVNSPANNRDRHRRRSYCIGQSFRLNGRCLSFLLFFLEPAWFGSPELKRSVRVVYLMDGCCLNAQC
jgi:hypothetical protein